jgi:hypothetical protein
MLHHEDERIKLELEYAYRDANIVNPNEVIGQTVLYDEWTKTDFGNNLHTITLRSGHYIVIEATSFIWDKYGDPAF